jgi:hypothetical protein
MCIIFYDNYLPQIVKSESGRSVDNYPIASFSSLSPSSFIFHTYQLSFSIAPDFPLPQALDDFSASLIKLIQLLPHKCLFYSLCNYFFNFFFFFLIRMEDEQLTSMDPKISSILPYQAYDDKKIFLKQHPLPPISLELLLIDTSFHILDASLSSALRRSNVAKVSLFFF